MDQAANGEGNAAVEQPDVPNVPVPVAVEYVERQLHELWRGAANAVQGRGGTQAVIRTQVHNLVVRAESHEQATNYLKQINNICGTHPGRVIVVVADQSGQEMAVQAWTAIHCQAPARGGRQVCCEEITLVAGGNAGRQLPAAVIPLLIPDLPVFLWWPQGTPFDDYLYRNLTDSTSRLIVDSSTFENPEGTLTRMAARNEASKQDVACSDMNWGRLTRWRELVAQFFDGQNMRPYLNRVGRVTVDYSLGSRGEVNRAQALLIAGWFASRLSWQPVEPVYQLMRAEGDRPAPVVLQFRAGKRPVRVVLRPSRNTSDVPGDIEAINVEVMRADPEAKPEARFAVARVPDPEGCALTSIEIEGAISTKRNIQMAHPSRAELLTEELEVFSRDKIYEEALEMVGQLIRSTAPKAPEAGPRRIVSGEPISAGLKTRPSGTPGQRPSAEGGTTNEGR